MNFISILHIIPPSCPFLSPIPPTIMCHKRHKPTNKKKEMMIRATTKGANLAKPELKQ